MAGWYLLGQGRRALSRLLQSGRMLTPIARLQLSRMPLTVFDIKGVPGDRRERIEAAVVAGGRHARGPHEAWIAADPVQWRVPRPHHGGAWIPAHCDIRHRRRSGRDREGVRGTRSEEH